MAVSMADITKLRKMTGAGMMDCKNALTESEGDFDKAVEIIRKKGQAVAAKRSDRETSEGCVLAKSTGDYAAMIALKCETDFVAKNEEFKELANGLAELVATSNPADVDTLLASTCPKCGKVVSEVIKEKIASIGEKITFRRFVRYEGNTASYIHNGKIGVLIETDNKDAALMNDICLHIASSAPEFITRAEIPQSVIDHETEVEMGKEDLQKKPEQIRAKIVEGRVNKLMSHRVLLEQPFIKNPDVTVGQLIEGKLTIKAFSRYMLGEGLEKRQENFADEVMSQVKG